MTLDSNKRTRTATTKTTQKSTNCVAGLGAGPELLFEDVTACVVAEVGDPAGLGARDRAAEGQVPSGGKGGSSGRFYR